MGIHQLLLAGAERRAHHTAWWWVERDRSLSYEAAVEQVDRMAGALGELGVRPGDRVGVFAHSGLDFVLTLFGAWRMGAAAAVVDVDTDALDVFLAATRPTVLVYTHDRLSEVDGCRELVGRHVCMDGEQRGAVGLADVLAGAPAPRPYAGSDTDVGLITAAGSYTTGDLLDAARDAAARLHLTADDVALGATPLWARSHTAASLLPALAVGATAAVSSRYSPPSAWDAVERIAATVLTASPVQLAGFAAECATRGKAPGSLRCLHAVDGGPPPDLELTTGIPVVAGPGPEPGP